MFLRALIPKIIVSTVTGFENEDVSDNRSESDFQFLVRYSCVEKSKYFSSWCDYSVYGLQYSSQSLQLKKVSCKD